MIRVSLVEAKQKFYRSVNSIFSRIGKTANENTILHLVYSKCVPIMLYGLDACGVSQTHSRLLKFITTRLGMKIFRTRCVDTVNFTLSMFGYNSFDLLAQQRSVSFSYKHSARENLISFLHRSS